MRNDRSTVGWEGRRTYETEGEEEHRVEVLWFMEVNQAAVRGQRHDTRKYPDGQPNLSDTNAHSAHSMYQLLLLKAWWDTTAHGHTDTASFEKRAEVFSEEE